MLVDRGAYDESLWIIADLLELIWRLYSWLSVVTSVGWIPPNSHHVSLNPDIIMTEIVGFYRSATTVDLLSLKF